ncbi:MAG: hypothetical protein AAF226_17315, partial [Verrucomicrobiota bacterium]
NAAAFRPFALASPPCTMLREPGIRLLNKAESKFGHLAIPHIVRWIACFQLMSFILFLFSGPQFVATIAYDADKIFSGEVWRLVTWVFIPRSFSVLFVVFILLISFFYDNLLTTAWGSFRLNIYVFSSILCLSLVGLIPIFSQAAPIFSLILYCSIIFAVGVVAGEEVIMLFGIIPVKLKLLAAFTAVMLLLRILLEGSGVNIILVGGASILGLAPFLLAVLPELIKEKAMASHAKVRKAKFASETTFNPNDAFHYCERCGITDLGDPTMEFRVTADGQELCIDCLNESKPEERSSEES